MNLYTLWHEIDTANTYLTHSEFTKKLYREMMNEIHRRKKEGKGEKWI